MLTTCTLLIFFFLLWTFLLTTLTLSLTRLGETRSVELFSARFVYYPLHRRFFPTHPFDILVFASNLGENLGRLGFVAMATYCTFQIPLPLIALVVLFLVLFLVIGDFFPRQIAMRYPKAGVSLFAFLYSLFLFLSLPISYIFLKLSEYSLKISTKEEGDPLEEMKETVVQILQSANVSGTLGTSDKKLIESVVRFKDRIVREVMVPRVDLFSVPVTTTLREAANLLVEEGYSRMPVYRETIDNIVGVLMFKDILELYMKCEAEEKEPSFLDQSVERVTKNVFYTPETKKVSHLLQEFRTKQMHMAIVVDEYGGTEGVVTIEDILEEIVGEIADEYDMDEEILYTTHPGGGSWIVDARMTINDVEEAFGILIPQEGEYDTIGGYVFHKVGAIPSKGLKIHHDEFDLEILSSTERSVEKVRITPRKKEKDD